jgi:hypothetical protein
MPWVRIDEHAMSHPKIAGLSDGAFRLWVQALAHCQNFLTDGLVKAVALRGMSAYNPKRRSELVTAGLWIEATDAGIQVHDYLQWNESREHVTAAREREKSRKRRWRDQKDAGRDAGQDAGQDGGRTVTSPVRACVSSDLQVVKEGGAGETRTPSERAGLFCEWYADTHLEIVGVGYMGSLRDYQKAIELCGKFTDQELQDAATIWFGQTDDFARNGTRSVPKFASRASDLVLRARRVTA